jgi:hypothetical protein
MNQINTTQDGPHNCIGCNLYQTLDGDDSPCCMNAIHWHGGTPRHPPCFEKAEYGNEMSLTPESRAAMNAHLRLVDTLGMDHPDTMRAMMLSMELAPAHIRDEISTMAHEMGLIPDADGYLEDGSPVFRLEDIAMRLGVSPAEAEETMHKMLAEREYLGLSNAGVVTDAALIHRKQ